MCLTTHIKEITQSKLNGNAIKIPSNKSCGFTSCFKISKTGRKWTKNKNSFEMVNWSLFNANPYLIVPLTFFILSCIPQNLKNPSLFIYLKLCSTRYSIIIYTFTHNFIHENSML